jgi:hypothetical protein
MKEKYDYTSYCGMSVPNGHTYEYIEDVLNNGLYKNFDITYRDGDMDRAILINKIDDTKFLFARTFNKKEFIISIPQIHLIREVY